MKPTPLDVDRLRSSSDLLSALREEQIARWTAGDRIPAEQLIAAFPELDADARRVLIVGEMMLRFEAGDGPNADDFAVRFPDQADSLRSQFDLHDTRDSSQADPTDPSVEALVSVPGYAITGEVGRGAWATVYLARHLVLGRPVALKLFHPARAIEPTFARRFAEEARILAKLDHPHIVRVYDSGTAGTRLYTALEYAPNGTLADRVKKNGPIPVADAVGIVAKLARAAGVAHRASIVHRDIKPGNVLFNRAGEPLLADFGLAKDVAASLGLTALGMAVGTPAYMPPEQTRAEPGTLGPPADVYALGAVLYELIAGTPPLLGKTTTQTLMMIQDDIPMSLAARDPAVPKWLSKLVDRCLDKDRDRRPPNGDALADLLLAGDVPDPTAPARRWWKWW